MSHHRRVPDDFEVCDEGTILTTKPRKINFKGAGVTATEPVEDEVDVTIPFPAHSSTTGQTADDHHARDHAATHSGGGADEIKVENLGATSTDTTKFFQPDGAGGVQVGTPDSGGQNTQDYSFAQSNKLSLQTASGSYVVKALLHFRGSTTMGTPANIKVTAWREGGTSAHIKIYDLTNSLAIAEASTTSTTQGNLLDLGTISNIPTGEAVFEIHMKATGGTANCGSLSIYY